MMILTIDFSVDENGNELPPSEILRFEVSDFAEAETVIAQYEDKMTSDTFVILSDEYAPGLWHFQSYGFWNHMSFTAQETSVN
jgi:hypothetical protein